MRDSMGALRLLALVGLHSDANAAASLHGTTLSAMSKRASTFKGDRKLDAIKGGRSTHAEHAASMATRVVEREAEHDNLRRAPAGQCSEVCMS